MEDLEGELEKLHTEIRCLHDRISDLESAKIDSLQQTQEQICRSLKQGQRERQAFFLAIAALIILSVNLEGDYRGFKYSVGGRYLPPWVGEAIAGFFATGSGVILLSKYLKPKTD